MDNTSRIWFELCRPTYMQVFSINIQSTLWLYKLHILYYVYAPGWLNFQIWSPRVQTADLGTSTSTDFSICGGVRNQSIPSETEGWLHSKRENLTPLKMTPLKNSAWEFPCSSVVKNPPTNVVDTDSNADLGRYHRPRSN